METVLIANETPINEINIGTEKFILTDKRFIHSNVGQSTFVGISELRGAETEDGDVKYYGFNLPDNNVLWAWLVIIAVVTSFSLAIIIDDAVLVSIIYFICAVPIIIGLFILLKIIELLSGRTEKRIALRIKTDGGYFIDQHYNLLVRDKVLEVATIINNIIYK